MLVLGRKLDESIIINGDIEVRVVRISGDRVRLAVTAPDGISINRKEVEEMIRRENAFAAQTVATHAEEQDDTL